MNKFRAKMKKQGGFTLIEMLIVVAIIAILIAIAIPLVNNVLERARDATDQANERAAKAEVLMYAMGVAEKKGEDGKVVSVFAADGKTTYFNAKEGTIQADPKDIDGYGKCKNKTGCYDYKESGTAHEGGIIKAEYDENTGEVKITWISNSSSEDGE